MSRIPRDERPPRRLRRDDDGSLYELDERRHITVRELADDVRGGRRFRVHQHGSERDCTQQVLLEVLATAAPGPALTAGGGAMAGALPGLAGAVGMLAGALSARWPGATTEHRAAEPDASTDGDARPAARRRRPTLELGDES
jgi:PHB/PHA accumulation regulator DNA-binding domain